MGCRQRRVIAATVVICALVPTVSSADTERIALQYEAFAGCPKRREFEARVLAVTSKAEFSDTGQREFKARLEQTPTGVVGSLEVVAGEDRSTREVRGKTCDEVASALALVTALAVDPNALGAEEPKAKPKPEPVPPNTLQGNVRLDRDTSRVSPRRGFVFSGGAGAALKEGIAPEPLPEARGFVDFGFGGRLAPALRGTFELSPPTDVRGGGIPARFAALGGALDASVRLLSIGDLTLSFFAGAELERVQAEALDLALSRKQTRLWSAAFLGPRVSLELPGLNYHSHRPGLFLELALDGVFPLIRQEYFVASPFREQVFVHKNPPFGLRGAASLGVRFL